MTMCGKKPIGERDMSKAEKPDKATIYVVVDAEIKRDIEAIARHHGRKITSEVSRALKAHIVANRKLFKSDGQK
jgi:hypothetical protein